MAKTIAIANQKGGVGKTTTAINLGGCLGALEYRTLIIDADPQANSTSGMGYDPQQERSIYDCLVNDINPADIILETNSPNVFLLPSHIDLVGAELEMIDLEEREFRLKKAIEKIADLFDVILIDCSPSLGLITVNSLVAADSVLVPVQCEYFALEGLSKLINTIKIVQGRLNPSLEIEGMLLTMYDTRLRLANQVVDEVKTHFQNLVFDTIIHRNTTLSESSSHGLPVIMHDAASKGAINYLNLAREILQKNNLTKMGNQDKQIDFDTTHDTE
jgi:chromosome partitioning protein